MSTVTIDIDPYIRKYNDNSAQFYAGTYALGAPVTVTDTDLTVYSVASGGSFSCSIPASTADITFSFGASDQMNMFQRMTFDGTFDSETSKSNVTSYTIYKNNASQTLPFSFVNGDNIYIEAVRTGAGAANILLNCSGITNPITYSSLSYFITRDMDYQENVADYPNKHLETDQTQQGQGNTTNYLTNFIGSSTVTGDFDIIFEPIEVEHAYMVNVQGINDGTVINTVANRFPRMAYSFYYNTAFSVRVYEFGVSKFIQANDSFAPLHWYKIEGRSGTIKYYKSTDNQATWTLLYTSLTGYTTETYKTDSVFGQGHYGIFKPARMIQQ